MTDTDLRAGIRAFLAENFLYMRPGLQFGDDDSLLKLGILDSLGVMELIGWMEQEHKVTVPQQDITEANFGTVAGIASYLAVRSAARQS